MTYSNVNKKEWKDKGIKPRSIRGWNKLRSLWINVYPDIKIRPKGRNFYSYCLVYEKSFRYRRRTGERNCTEKKWNNKSYKTKLL